MRYIKQPGVNVLIVVVLVVPVIVVSSAGVRHNMAQILTNKTQHGTNLRASDTTWHKFAGGKGDVDVDGYGKVHGI